MYEVPKYVLHEFILIVLNFDDISSVWVQSLA